MRWFMPIRNRNGAVGGILLATLLTRLTHTNGPDGRPLIETTLVMACSDAKWQALAHLCRLSWRGTLAFQWAMVDYMSDVVN